MNATQRLIEAAERLHHLHLCEQEGIRSGAPNPVDWYEAVDAIGMALAAAKEEAERPTAGIDVSNKGVQMFDKGIDVVSDAELELQFRGTNFGGADHREVLAECLRSTAKGYAVGSTIRHIATNLGLIEQQDHDRNRITDKGLRFLTGATGKDEPVAWMTDHPMLFTDVEEARSYCDDDEAPTPLYAHPPTTGIDVERVVKAVMSVWESTRFHSATHNVEADIRKALEAHAENRGEMPNPWISVDKELPPISESDQEEDYVLVLWHCADWRHSPYKTQKVRRAICDHDDEGTPLWFWVDETGDPIDDDDNLIVAWSRIDLPSPPDTDKG